MPPGDDMEGVTEDRARILAQEEIDKKHLEHVEMNQAQIEKSISKELKPINEKLTKLDIGIARITSSMKTNQRWTVGLIAIGAVVATLLSGKI